MSDKLSTIEQAIWVSKSLFDRGKTAGSSANLSFKQGGRIYITASGTCFGALERDSFAVLDEYGVQLDEKAPSKEYPLHMTLYKNNPDIQAVIHTHSFYSVLWSCLQHANTEDIIPPYTPYLRMQLGKIALVPYAPPGSEQLFSLFEQHNSDANGYILAHHGPIVGGKTIMSAFNALEELEESAKIAWTLRHENIATI